MTRFIRIGGIGIILAVFAIFVFILSQVVPLFRPATVRLEHSWPLPPDNYIALDSDENGHTAFLLTDQGCIRFLNTATGESHAQRLPLPADQTPTCFSYHPGAKRLVVGTDKGTVHELHISSDVSTNGSYAYDGASITLAGSFALGPTDAVVRVSDIHGSAERRLVVCSLSFSNSTVIKAALVQHKRTLIGKPNWKTTREWELTDQFSIEPVRFSVNGRGDGAIAIRRDGKVCYLELIGNELRMAQQFFPFGATNQSQAAIAEYIFGNDSLVFAHPTGSLVGFSLYKQGDSGRRWGLTKTFAALPSSPRAYASSHRNKSYLIGGEQHLSLRHFTTCATRWEEAWTNGVQLVALGNKHNMFWVLDANSPPRLHRFMLHDPHAEAGLAAYFGKIWYEGSSEPKFEWQSTGGSDDFEPKLSMVPLILGTLKGTFYAMLFSTPLALLAALYTSQFAHPNLRRFIKPTLEIMASLPSVILGFLAALWLAPLLEQRIPSVLLVLITVPLVAVVSGEIWTRLPQRFRSRIPLGYEFLLLIPILFLGVWLAWSAGPWVERYLFIGRDQQTGASLPDFRLWWTQTLRLPYEQRNSLIVGFMMGFAVIPIIFTIAEDALSNVPSSMRSASLALGATRWQTALRIVCPTASAGIFSAIMVGFGRAVGETMIVLMATGNTPIMSWNIFSGMRTLSANIAVELPEAPHHSTLYRTLFLGALLLFAMTFVVNTVAELLRHHLREKYKMA